MYSNDPQNPRFTLKVEATVKALIEVNPSTMVTFRGMADSSPEAVIDLIGPSTPFHLKNIESDLDAYVGYGIETVEEGRHYRIKVGNKTKRGNYKGYLKVYTDLPQKPDILVHVSGFIEGEVSVKPLTVLIGKLSADQPERPGRVMVTDNHNVPFQITNLGYDERLMAVTQYPLENQAGYLIEISPKLSGVPVGSRQQTTLTIETSAVPNEKEMVQVHVFNSADKPSAQNASPQPKRP